MEFLHEILVHIVEISVLVFEIIGIFVILTATTKAVWRWIHHDVEMKVHLMEGMTTGLAFMIGSEIMRTITAHDFTEMIQIGAIILLRASITILLNWEIRNEEKHDQHTKGAK